MRRALLRALLVPLAVSCSGVHLQGRDDGKVRSHVLTRGDVSERFLLTGELDAVSSESLAVPKTPQWNISIRWLEADGTSVTAGQKVAELDNSAFASNLAEQKLAAAQAANDLAFQVAQNAITTADKTFAVDKAKIELEKARLEAAVPSDTRAKRDHQQKQLEQQRATVALARATDDLDSHVKSAAYDVKVRQIAIEKAQREIQAAEAAIGSVVLTAPRDGIVVIAEHPWEGRKLDVGDNVWVGLPVVRLPDLRTMKVNALLSDVDDGRVVVGMRVNACLDAYPDVQFPGTITEISPVAREPSQRSWRRSFLVTVTLERTDPARMLPGMSVKVEVEGRHIAGSLIAPRTSVDLAAKPPRLRLANGSTVALMPVVCDALRCAVRSDAQVETLTEGTLLGSGGS